MHIFARLKHAPLSLKAPLTVILCIVISISGAVFVSYRVQENELVNIKRTILSDIVGKIQTDIDETAALAASRAVMLATIPSIVEAFRKEDREWLAEQLKTMFFKQKQKYFMSELQFHKAPATTFLRIHKDGGYGEDLSGFRETVVLANKEKRPQKGLELGRAGLGIRGVVPISDADGHIGSMEFVFTMKNIINKYKSLTSSEIAVFIETKLFDDICTLISVKSDSNNSAEAQSNIIGEYTHAESSNKEKIFSYINTSNLEKSSDEKITFPMLNKEHFGIIFYPLNDFAGKNIGKITVVKSFEDLHIKFYKKILWEIINGIVRIIVLASAVFVVFNGLTLYPLIELVKRCKLMLHGKNVSLADFAHQRNQLDTISHMIKELHPTRTANDKYIAEESGMENTYTTKASEDDVMNYGFQNDVLL
ncbi:MAG: cache domain-containing protein [Bacteroidota bacterium]